MIRRKVKFNSTYIIQNEHERMIETARSIQSFPSTRAYSTSFSAGKYSGMGIGSVNGKMKFNFIFSIYTRNAIAPYSPPVTVVVAKLYETDVFPASFFADIFS